MGPDWNHSLFSLSPSSKDCFGALAVSIHCSIPLLTKSIDFGTLAGILHFPTNLLTKSIAYGALSGALDISMKILIGSIDLELESLTLQVESFIDDIDCRDLDGIPAISMKIRIGSIGFAALAGILHSYMKMMILAGNFDLGKEKYEGKVCRLGSDHISVGPPGATRLRSIRVIS